MPQCAAVRGILVLLGAGVAAAVAGSCGSGLRHCSDGRIPPTFCHEPTKLCVLPDKVDGGDGRDAGGIASDGGEGDDAGMGSCPTAGCPTGSWCSEGQCTAKQANGTGCDGGVVCGSGICVAGLCCDGECVGGCGRCDLPASKGICTAVARGDPGTSPSCAPYVCDGVGRTCPTNCSDAGICVSTSTCTAGSCTGRKGNGQTCTSGTQCVSDQCVDGVCCNFPCDGSCDVCNAPSTLGICTLTDPGSAGSPACAPFVCNGASAACPGTCTSDTQCVVGDYCASGSCVAKKDNGQGCTATSQCKSGYCNTGVCCASGICCTSSTDCPGSFRSAAVCGDLGASTNCQGTRKDATCVSNMCGSSVQDDDSACTGASRTCGAYKDVGCTAANAQPVAACGTQCSNASDCNPGYTCSGIACVLMGGAGESCTGTGQGTCQTNMKCEVGVCCASGGGTCCGATHPCATGLACNATTFVCSASCTPNSSVGGADPANQYCTDSAHCVSKLALGDSCTADGQCGGGHCVDHVCCDSTCNDKVCQRCDAASSSGKGHCGWNASQNDPDSECSISSWACNGKCGIITTTYTCSGASYACATHQVSTSVASGSVCVSNAIVPVSNTDYCNAGSSCADGACSAQQWWTSCNGSGSCRAANDTANAFVAPVYASTGYTLTSSCGTSGAALCGGTTHCSGQTQYAGYSCDAAHTCGVNAQKTGCCGCGNFGCDLGAYVCKGSCLADGDCASGSYCITTVAGFTNTCQGGALNDVCDVPLSSTQLGGQDCDPGLTCTSAKICKLIENQGCTSSDQCGQNYGPGGHYSLLSLTCRAAGSSGGFGVPLACNGGAAYCCD